MALSHRKAHMDSNRKPPSQLADRYIIRFEKPGHRDELKRQAIEAKRTLNKHLLMLIEKGQKEAQQ